MRGCRRRESGVEGLYGVDSQQYGNEMRMCNHFKVAPTDRHGGTGGWLAGWL